MSDRANTRRAALADLMGAGAVAVPADLPIAEWTDRIVDAIRDSQVVIVAGETGSGKSTQLPKLCLLAGRGQDGLIGHTQPRRVAARSVAERLSDELGVRLGDQVGYTVRFHDQVADDTIIRVMTDGILLNEIQRDRMLSRYDTLIIDEAHERSLNVDFILGFLKQLLGQRPELRVIVTSATIDTDRFADHFSSPDGVPAPVFIVEGRTYPVMIRYRPYGRDNPDDPDDRRDQVTAVVDAVIELFGPPGHSDRGGVDGDVLVFLSGEREIRDTADALVDANRSGKLHGELDILPLYARLSANDQHRIFQSHRGRRVVLATNIAETSITVPGIRTVIDTGMARISRYSRRLKVQRLPIEPVSQASAAQRSGRCGRVGPGVAIRLYSEQDFIERPEFTEPEILRTNLASVILQMTAIGLGDVARFPFVEPPDHAHIKDGYALLDELGALKSGRIGAPRQLTATGRQLARLPVDPRLGRMIIEAGRRHCVREVLVIAAALSIQDVRERPDDQPERAAELHNRFRVAGSDFLSTVKLWEYVRARQRELSGNRFRRMCRDEYLHYLRIREWTDLYSQLRRVAGDLKLRPATVDAHPDQVHQAVLAGLLSHIGERAEDGREFVGARDARFAIARGSVLSRRPPAWVMAAELVETNRLWARQVAEIQPEWCEKLAHHLVKRSYGDAWWDEAQATAKTSETVTLFGRPIVRSRVIDLARIDPGLAHSMFVEFALASNSWDVDPRSPTFDFVAYNHRFLARVELLEARVRRTDLYDERSVIEFFDQRVPASVVDVDSFRRWWDDARVEAPELLRFDSSLLSNRSGIRLADYPDEWPTATGVAKVTYRFAPDTPLDGAALMVPVVQLAQLDAAGLDWLIPGYRRDLVDELVRTLPKEVRRDLVPMNATVDDAVDQLERLASATPRPRLVEVLADVISERSGRRVPSSLFHPERLPPWLRMHIVVTAPDGTVLDAGDDLEVLRERQASAARAALSQVVDADERRGITSWDVGELASTIERRLPDGQTVIGYPTLVDAGESVSLRIVDNAALQQRAMRGGVVRLAMLAHPQMGGRSAKRLPPRAALDVAAAERDTTALADECVAAVVEVVIARRGLPTNADEFAQLSRAVADEDQLVVDALLTASEILAVANRIHHQLMAMVNPALDPTVADAASHRDRLIAPGFVRRSGIERLPDVHRYMRGIEYRLQHLDGDVARDQRRMALVHPVERSFAAAIAQLGATSPELREIAWMIEEWRLAEFAPAVGPIGPISQRRIERAFEQATQQRLDAF